MIVLTESDPTAIAPRPTVDPIIDPAMDPAMDLAMDPALQTTAAIAQLLGFPVYPIAPAPAELATAARETVETPQGANPGINSHIPSSLQAQVAIAEQALSAIPAQPQPTQALWLGKPPTPERYTALHTAALRKNLCLLNTPEQHQRAQAFDQAYPHLTGLTPESQVVENWQACQTAARRLGFPLVVQRVNQSAIQPRHPILVKDWAELESIVPTEMFRDRLLLRRWVKLRSVRTTAEGFPMGREFSVILHGQRVITYGYRWSGEDDQRYLSTPEEEDMFAVALEAARRLEVPFVAIAIGQQEDDQWTVINTRDPQFGGLGQIPLIQFWHELAA